MMDAAEFESSNIQIIYIIELVGFIQIVSVFLKVLRFCLLNR